MSVVAKLDVLRKAMDLDPVNRKLVFPGLVQDPDALEAVVLGREVQVAAHADFHRRHPRRRQAFGPGVTVEAVELELAGVMGVAEGNRLIRTRERLVPGRVVGLARRECGKESVELRRNLDLEIRILLHPRLQRLRFTDALGAERVTGRGAGETTRPLQQEQRQSGGDEQQAQGGAAAGAEGNHGRLRSPLAMYVMSALRSAQSDLAL